MDALPAFDLFDDDNDSKSLARDTRIERAFSQSKESYKNELVVTPPGVSSSLETGLVGQY